MSAITLKKNGQDLKDRISSGQGLINIVTRDKKKTIEEIRELVKFMNPEPGKSIKDCPVDKVADYDIKRTYGLFVCDPPKDLIFNDGKCTYGGKDVRKVTDSLRLIERGVPTAKRFDFDSWVMIFPNIHKSLEDTLNVRLIKDILINNDDDDTVIRRCLIIIDEVDGKKDMERERTSIDKLPIDLHGYASNSIIWD